MKYSRSLMCAALAIASVWSQAGAQQDTTRRTTAERRISVSKGEVALARVDTVIITRTDTVRTTITRVDTVQVTVPVEAVVFNEPRGAMYWGVYTGTTDPWGNIDRLYTKGFHAGGVLGWEAQRSLFGLRLDGAMSQVNREQARNTQLVGTGTPLMLHLAGTAKIKPLNFGGWALYGIGGVNYNRYKRIATVATSENATHCGAQFDGQGGCYLAAEDTRWSDKFGFNVGAGLDFHIGSQDMFLEGRYFALQANSARTWFLPISLGVRYF
jgi:opacity protein-like surface antigen